MEGRMTVEKTKDEVNLNDDNEGRGEDKTQKEQREKQE
jgi:hypothetical protein